MKTPITYYGGKQNMLQYILPLIPEHKQYVEPFLGGAAVFFAKPKSDHEVVNDLDGRITNFFRVCQSKDFYKLQEMINGTPNSEIPYLKTKDIMNGKVEPVDDIEFAWAFWCQTTMTFSSQICGGFAFANNDIAAKKTMNKRDQFTKRYMDRLQNVEIFQRDAVDLIKMKDGEDVFFYNDPPYVSSAQSHYSGYTEEHFIRLLDTLAEIKGKFLLSCYPETCLDLYDDCNWHRKEIVQHTSVANVRVSDKNTNTVRKDKTECLIWNYDKVAQKPIFYV
jgi:DNA adenine methylase